MIEVDNLQLTYHTRGAAHAAVKGVSFRVEKGQFYTLLGPSGCGKTTTLRCLAGLERPDGGVIRIDGQVVASADEWVPGNRRHIGMVFQSYAIWPHLSVFDNVAFPLRYGDVKVAKADVERRVRAALELVQLGAFADRPAPHLSGGQQQRLALARAFVMEPKVLLLDEPLSNLDAKLREEMRVELRRLVKSLGITTVFVTHEQIEALTLSDTIAVMKDGVIAQEGSPLEIYQRPKSAFVADFIGQSNVVSGTVVSVEGGVVRVECALGLLACTANGAVSEGEGVSIAIRPEHLQIEPAAADNVFSGTLESARFTGGALECTVRATGKALKVMIDTERSLEPGATLRLGVAARHCLVVR